MFASVSMRLCGCVFVCLWICGFVCRSVCLGDCVLVCVGSCDCELVVWLLCLLFVGLGVCGLCVCVSTGFCFL